MNTKRTLAIGVTSATAAAVIAAPLLTQTAAASTPQSFTLRMHSVSDTTVDNGAKGFSAGDLEVQSTRLTRNGTHVGWEAGDCLTARVAKTADQICRFELHLAKGQIVAEGTLRAGQQGPGTFALAITGGTGQYDAARGVVKVTATSGNSVPIEVDLR